MNFKYIIVAVTVFVASLALRASDVLIVPVNESGLAVVDQAVTATADGDTYRALSVELEYGFMIAVTDTEDNVPTYYSLSDVAVHPVVIGYPNPLQQVDTSRFIALSSGTYDIAVSDIGSEIPTICINASGAVLPYPKTLYLVTADGAVERADGDGIYTFDCIPEHEFLLTYEPIYDVMYSFGSPSRVSGELSSGESEEIIYGSPTYFSYNNIGGYDSPALYQLTVSLVPGDSYVEVTHKIVSGVEIQESAAGAQEIICCDLNGRRMTGTLTAGIYIAVGVDGVGRVVRTGR